MISTPRSKAHRNSKVAPCADTTRFKTAPNQTPIANEASVNEVMISGWEMNTPKVQIVTGSARD